MEPIITIKNLQKKYRLGAIGTQTFTEAIDSWIARIRGKGEPISKKEFYALDGFDLTVNKGDRLGIIGMNGAGKSTLLKILSRITSPTEGRVEILGKISSMLEVGTGFDRELTGRENAYLNGAILGMSKKEVDSKIQSIIDFSEIGKFIDTPVKRYSSGMYVKLAFSVAAHLDSEILIMDEVLAVGDIAFQKKCLEKMNSLAKNENRTILYVSHNMNTIRTLCNRCIVLEKGKKIFDGDVDSAIDCYSSTSGEISTYRTFEDYKRDDVLTNYKAQILSVELLGQSNCVIELYSHITLKIKLKCFFDVEDIHFRIIVKKNDGTPCGSTMSSGIPNCKKNDEKTVVLEFDSSAIAPGKYSITLILFHPDKYGGQEKYDMVENAMQFEIINSKGALYNWEWSFLWGTAVYPELKILETEKKI